MKNIFSISFFCMICITIHAQTIVNREWTQLAGVPDPLSISTSCIDFQNNVITASSAIVTGQDANISVIKYATDGTILWQNSFNGISNGKDYATSVKTDATGNVYVIGTTYNSSSNYDFILIKYNSQGVLQWQQIYNGTGNNIDVPTALTLDNSNNIYVVGASTGTNTLTDYTTIKYTNAGVQQWVSTYDYSQGYEAPVGIDIDPNTNNIYVTGASASTSASNNWDFATIEYSPSGTQVNANRVTSIGNGLDKPSAICRDNSGNIYVTGSYFNQTNNSYDIKTIKLNSSLILQWTMTFNGDNLDDGANSIDVDPLGNVFVAGYVKRSTTGENIIVLKYSPIGNLLWQKEVNEENTIGDEQGNKIIVDVNGNAYITGSYIQNGNKNFISMKFDPNGTVNWQDIYNGAGNGDDEATSIDININGNIVVSGKAFDGVNDRNSTIQYNTISINTNNLGNTTNNTQFIKNEIIIKFDPSIINPAFSDNIDWQFAPINEVIPDSTKNKIATALSIENPEKLILVKIYNWMTLSDSISTARNGKQFVMDKIWSTYRMLLPNNIVEQTAFSNLDTLTNEIEFAQLNYILEHDNVPNDTYCYSDQYSLIPSTQFPNASIHADEAWDIETGKPFVRVGVVDGLVNYKHEDLGGGTLSTSKVIDGEDFDNNLPLSSITNTFNMHGTACAGIIGAISNNNIGIAGIAGGNGQPNTGVSIITLGSYADIAPITTISNAIAKGASNTYNGGFGYFCDILSNSYGYKPNDYDPTIAQSVKLAFDNHCVFVAARGNRTPWASYSQDALRYPSCLNPNYVISVGASGNNGKRKQSSGNGDTFFESMTKHNVDVIAPGSMDIVLTLNYNSADLNDALPTNPEYKFFNGTSSAAPHVAGLAALMLSHINGNPQYPNFIDDGDVQYLIKKYAQDIGNEGSDDVGNGLINAKETMEHIDINHGYWVMHSSQANSSFTGQLYNMGTNFTLYLDDAVAPGGFGGQYKATKIKNVYTHTIPLPSFTTNPQILDTWITHSGGVSANTQVNGIYNADITTSISNGIITATYTTYIWKLYEYMGSQLLPVPIWYPCVTNSLDPNFSMLMYDPSIVTGVRNTIFDNSIISIYPNPVSDIVNISFDAKNRDKLNIQILNTLGQKVVEKEFVQIIGNNKIEIPVTSLSNGFYNIITSNSNSTATSKLIINH